MFKVHIAFQCGCSTVVVPTLHPATGKMAPGIGITQCDEHKPSELDINQRSWSPTGLVCAGIGIEDLPEENKIVGVRTVPTSLK